LGRCEAEVLPGLISRIAAIPSVLIGSVNLAVRLDLGVSISVFCEGNGLEHDCGPYSKLAVRSRRPRYRYASRFSLILLNSDGTTTTTSPGRTRTLHSHGPPSQAVLSGIDRLLAAELAHS